MKSNSSLSQRKAFIHSKKDDTMTKLNSTHFCKLCHRHGDVQLEGNGGVCGFWKIAVELVWYDLVLKRTGHTP